jgi:hypothetical protein
MGVLESLAEDAEASIEILPPARGGDIDEILAAVEPLLAHSLAFVSVTDHPGGQAWTDGESGAERVALGADRLAVEDLLIDLHYAGFRDLFVIRGDERFSPPPPSGKAPGGSRPAGGRGPGVGAYAHAADLVAHVQALNRGTYSPPAGAATKSVLDALYGIGGSR